MPAPLIRRIKKGKGKTACELGMLLLQLLSHGYKKYVIEDLGDYIEVRTWRYKREKDGEG
jgi:hypothetical protein